LQERFHDFVPALSKWSGTVVGLTLIAIGLMGIYETYFEGQHAEEEEEQDLKLAMAGERYFVFTCLLGTLSLCSTHDQLLLEEEEADLKLAVAGGDWQGGSGGVTNLHFVVCWCRSYIAVAASE
jgi:hypothetical protein